jgi:hypothetical protein
MPGLDRAQICHVGGRRAVAVAETKFPNDVPLRLEHTLIHVPHISAAQA